VPQPQVHIPQGSPPPPALLQTEPRTDGFGALVDRLAAVVWEADAATLRLSFVSSHAEELFGYPLRRWLEEPDFWEATIHESDRSKLREHLRSLAPGDHVLVYRVVRADGTVLRIRDLVHVVGDWHGRPRGLYGVMVEAGQTGETGVPVEERELPPGRIATGPGLDVDQELFALEGRLQGLVGADVDITVVSGLGAARVDIDAAALGRLLADLCLEARDAMLQGGSMTITTGVAPEAPSLGAGRFALLAVRDTGVGIDAVLRARIFESLFSVARHEDRAQPEGGLARAREIVADAGGELVVSTAPGQGSTFEIYLPLA
jgi:PAS domain-containing protein